MINVVILDDHQLFVDGIVNSFKNFKEIAITDYALNGAEGLELIKSTQPDVVILDIEFTKTKENGIDILRSIRKAKLNTKVLVVTSYCDNNLISTIKKEGADGYRLKNISIKELKQSILNIAAGKSEFKYEQSLLLNKYHYSSNNTLPLSQRALEIIHFLSLGLTVKQTALKIGIAESTINDHLERAKRKVGAKNNCELVSIVSKAGLI